MNMKNWVQEIMASQKRHALPLLSFPSIQLLGISVKELIADSEVQARGMLEVAKRCPTAASVSMMDLSVEAECFGANIRVSDDEVPTVVGAVVQDPEDAEALKVPEIGTGRTGNYTEAIAKVAKELADRPVFAGVIGPFSLAGRLMEMTEIMYNCYDEPEMVHTTLEKGTEFLTNYAKAYKEAGAQGVVIAEPAAGLLSPELCREFSAPYVKRIVDAVQDDEFMVVYHNCGNAVTQMVPEILAPGSMGFHFGNAIDIEDMLKAMPSDKLILGNLDPVSVFRTGTPEMVREKTLSLLERCSKYPNFLISSGCDIPPATPWANIDAFFEAVEEFYK